MKKLFAILALVLGMVSCQNEPEALDVVVGGEQEVMLSVSLPEGTRANSAEGFDLNNLGDEYKVRYILEISYNGNLIRDFKITDATSATFPVRLAPNRDYTFTVWADLVKAEKANVEVHSDADLYYNTVNGLANIELQNWTPNVEARDAWTATQTVTYTSSNKNIGLELKRPFAKVRVVATDIAEIRKFDIEPTNAVAEYAQEMYTEFDAVAGAAKGETTGKTHTFNYADVDTYEGTNGEQLTLFADYVLVPADGNVQFTLSVYDNTKGENALIKANNFNTTIPVAKNKVTTIKGHVLTEGGDVSITIDGTLGEGETINYVEVDNATDLQKTINEATEKTSIVLAGDIDLGDLFDASILSTRAAATLPIVIAEDKAVVLDLNGHKITTPFVEGSTTNHTYAFENHGSLTIQDSEGNGKVIARGIFNYGTMTLESGTIDACDGNGGYGVRNYDGAEFVMNGGSIVTSYEDGDAPGSGYDASPVRVDEGATATFNGGTINNISNFTVAIDNYGETTINGGTFTTIHTTIANSATMTINGGSFTCDGLEGITAHAFWAAAGTATINGGTFDGKDNYNGFNIDASKGATVNINGGEFLSAHSGSLYGNGTIIVKGGEFFDEIADKYVASGYEVVEENGMYTVAKSQALVAFEEAIANGGNVTLTTDITLSETVVIESGKTVVLDLNGKTLSAADMNVIKNNGGNLTIKNGTVTRTGDVVGYSVNNASGEITIENATIARGLYTSGSKMTANNANISHDQSSRHAIYAWNCEVAINGGTYHNNNAGNATLMASGSSVVTINGGTFSIADGRTTLGWTSCMIDQNSTAQVIIKDGQFNGGFRINSADTVLTIEGGEFNTNNGSGYTYDNGTVSIKGGTYTDAASKEFAKKYVAEGYGVITKDNTYIVIPTVLKDGDVLDLGGAEYDGTITVEGNVTIKGDTKIKTLKSTTGCTITIEDGKTLTLNNFSFGAKDNATAEYEIKGGTVTANYGFFQHGEYTLRSNFETGYMYYSYGSDITVYGTFHSQGKGDGLDYVRGKLTIAKGGKSIHDKSLWVGQPESWGAMNASLVIEDGGYVQANSLSVYKGSSLTYSNDADLKYNSVTGTEYFKKE